MQAREPHLDHALPERGVEARLALEQGPHVRGRALVVEELPDRLLEQLLLFREFEVHLLVLLSAKTSRGSPRPRSPITLRWMLAVPPATAIPSEYMY